MTSADMSVDVTVFLDSTTATVSRVVSSPISLDGSADRVPPPPADQSSLDPDCVVVLPHDTVRGQAVHHTTNPPALVQVHLDSPVVCVHSPTPITHLATAGIVHAHTDNNVDTSCSGELSDQHSQHSKFILDAPLEVMFDCFDTRADLESKNCGHCQRTPPPGPLLFKPTLERFWPLAVPLQRSSFPAYLLLYQVVRKTGLPNYLKARMPVPSGLHIENWKVIGLPRFS